MTKKKGPGKGWHGPPEGTHGTGMDGDTASGSGGGSGAGALETKEEADKYLAGSGSLNPELSKDEQDAMGWYKGDGYADINSEMRDGGYSTDPRADFIESAVQKGKTDKDLVAYRGVDYDAFEDYDDLTGDTFTDNAFVSTSLSKKVAESHSDGALIEIHVPKGTPALNMEQWKAEGFSGGESELLLKSGITFKVVSDTGVDSDPRNMVVEAMP